MNKLRIKVITTLIESVTEVMDSLATFGGRIAALLDERHPREAGAALFDRQDRGTRRMTGPGR